jgi:hypothetical protein
MEELEARRVYITLCGASPSMEEHLLHVISNQQIRYSSTEGVGRDEIQGGIADNVEQYSGQRSDAAGSHNSESE